MTHSPLVSVVMPAYNHERYVEQAVESVFSQTYKHIELIAIDDGSKDNTWSLLERVAERIGARMKVARQTNSGVCRTLNRAIAMSRGSLISVLASDDYYLPNKLESQVEVFRSASEQLALVHTGAFLDYQNKQDLEDITGSYPPAIGLCFEDVLTQKARIVAPSIMFRRSAFDAVNGFDTNLAAEDVDFFVSLAARGFAFGYVAQPLVVKRVVEGSGGSHLAKLIRVHEEIAAKHRPSIGEAQYQRLVSLMYTHLIQLSVGAGDFNLSMRTALDRTRTERSLYPLQTFLRSATRAAFLRALPSELRHNLRLARTQIRQWTKR